MTIILGNLINKLSTLFRKSQSANAKICMAKLAKLTNFRHEVMTFPKISRQFFDYFPKLVDIFLILLTLKGTLPRLSSLPVQIFIGQNFTSQRSKYEFWVISFSIFIFSSLSFSKICSRQNIFVILQPQTHVGMYAYILRVGLHTYLMAFTNACF